MPSIDAYAGQPFVFQVVFLDPLTGVPVPVTNVNVTAFYYDTGTGARIMVLTSQPMNPVTPPDPSRYTYVTTLNPAIPDGTPLYVEYRGTDVLLNVLVQTDLLNVHVFPSDLGLRARFLP
jgi:hypothetical protein